MYIITLNTYNTKYRKYSTLITFKANNIMHITMLHTMYICVFCQQLLYFRNKSYLILS